MTYEEALNIKQKLSPIQAKNDLERYLLRNEPPIYKAVAIAMQALEKQIPQKPLHDMSGYYCPVCNEYFDEFHDEENFCYHCGQALKW